MRRSLMVLCLVLSAACWPGGAVQVFGQLSEVDDPEANAEQNEPRPDVQSLPYNSTIAVIPVEGMIYGFTNDSIQRRTDRAIAAGADLIVFEIDTPGGLVDAALDISSYIKTIPVPTVAWVNREAFSAGILIASACDEMVMSRASLTGDCAPIVPGMSLEPTERAKQLSPLLEAFRANAAANFAGPSGSDYAAFHAMCVLGIEVYQVRHKETGEVRLVNSIDYAVMVGDQSPDDFNAPNQSPGTPGGSQRGQSVFKQPSEYDVVAGPSLNIAGYDDQGKWELIAKVHDGNTLLTVSEKRAADMGLSKAIVSNRTELKQLYGAGQILEVNQTWSESLANFFVHPFVRGALLVIFILGMLLEYFSPGLIVPSVVGLVALALLIGAPFVVGLASVWHIGLLLLGIVLIGIELIATPTFGVLGLVGIVMMFAGFVLSVVPTGGGVLPAQGTGGQVLAASMSMVIAMILIVPGFIVLMRYFGSLPLFNRLILADESEAHRISQSGETINKPYTHISGDESIGGGKINVGMVGTVSHTGLRPHGNILINDELIDATSPGTWIEPDTKIKVIEVHGNIITVEEADA